MTHQPVKSSTIESCAFDAETGGMEIKFRSGKTYAYGNMTQEKFDEMMNSESIGKHFHANIRGNPTHQVEVPKQGGA